MRQLKIFISHSWKDKFQVHKMVETLRPMPFLQIWVDAEQLQPGARIQTEIDDELASTDVVVLMWSQNAMASGGVKAEMRTCERLQKRLVICKLDKTPLPGSWLPQMKSVNLIDHPELGINRLAASLFNLMPPEWKNVIPPEMLTQWNQYTGDIEVIGHFAYTHKPSEQEKHEVADYMQQKLDSKKARLDQHLTEAQTVGEAINGLMQRMEKNLNDTQALNSLLQEAKLSKHAAHPMFKTFVAQFERMMQAPAPTNHNAQHITPTLPPTAQGQKVPEQFIKSINSYRQKIEAKKQSTYQFCKGTIGILMSREAFDSKFNAFVYFFTSAADVLQDMVQSYYQRGNQTPQLYDTIIRLTKYLDDENAGLPDSQGGLIGLIDDAYLIHKSLPGLKNSGSLPDSHLSLDTSRINLALTWIELLVGAAVIATLNQTLQGWQQSSDGWDKVRAGRASIREAQLRSLATDAGIDW